MGSARECIAVYRKSCDLVSIGAYQAGTNPQIDRAIQLHEPINGFLKQNVDETCGHDASWQALREIMQGAEAAENVPAHQDSPMQQPGLPQTDNLMPCNPFNFR